MESNIQKTNELTTQIEGTKEKLLTLVVPCYNSESYMSRCLDTLVEGGDEVEIIIVDDGSTDQTGVIADNYAAIYHNMVKVIHKENGGHGSGVNAGLAAASGIYYKVVDSDDWFNVEAYQKLLNQIRAFRKEEQEKIDPLVPDLFVCNYVYDHLEEGVTRSVNYRNVFPEEKMCGWNTMKSFGPSQYLVMHALIFRTQILRDADVKLPEHTFYVDNLFSYQPLPLVRNIYYMDMDLYHYYLGREDQSVNEKVLMNRIDQQIYVTRLVSQCVDLDEVAQKYPKLAVYMRRNISIMMAISSIHLLLINTRDAYQKRAHLWEEIKQKNAKLYYQLKYRTLSGLTYLPGKVGGKLTIGGYRIANRIYKFQ